MRNHVLAEEVLLLHQINEKITRCTLCPLMIKHMREIGNTKTKSICTNLIGQSLFQLLVVPRLNYWLLDWPLLPTAEIEQGGYLREIALGDWLVRALFETGFANKPTSISKAYGPTIIS
jgi:hypothetical protein